MNKINYQTVIIGAGACGLSAAYHLSLKGRSDYLIIERNGRVGGIASTDNCDGFHFDSVIHLLFPHDLYVQGLINNVLLKDKLRRFDRVSYCYDGKTYIKFPYQAHNYGLPMKVIFQNIFGLIRAHYGSSRRSPANYEEWIYKTFGRGIANNCLIPYSRNLWAWDLKDMSYDWASERVPAPSIREVLAGALMKSDKLWGPTKSFWYPIQGGISLLSEAFLDHIPKDKVLFNRCVVAIDTVSHEVILQDGMRIGYGKLISTMPLPVLIQILKGDAPAEIMLAASELRYNFVHTVNICLEGVMPKVKDQAQWVYSIEKEACFHRLSFPHIISKWMVPGGCSSVQAEISESNYRYRDKSRIVQDTLDGLVRMGMLTRENVLPIKMGGNVLSASVSTLNPAYIIYDHKHKKNTSLLKEYLHDIDIESSGRFGDWEYYNLDQAIMSGKRAIEGNGNGS